MEMMLLLFVFIMAAFLGFELISKVPSQLHTPLMSGTNAISGITLVGALIIMSVHAAKTTQSTAGLILSFAAIVFASINVVGGYMVTQRMLGMFKQEDKK